MIDPMKKTLMTFAILSLSAGHVLAQDVSAGEKTYAQCKMCHLVGEKAKKDIKLSVLAFGQNRFGKAMITRLAK